MKHSWAVWLRRRNPYISFCYTLEYIFIIIDIIIDTVAQTCIYTLMITDGWQCIWKTVL